MNDNHSTRETHRGPFFRFVASTVQLFYLTGSVYPLLPTYSAWAAKARLGLKICARLTCKDFYLRLHIDIEILDEVPDLYVLFTKNLKLDIVIVSGHLAMQSYSLLVYQGGLDTLYSLLVQEGLQGV